MATILNNQKSNGGSPYCYYTVTASYSARTTFGVTISGTITSHLASSSSNLGTGPTMGLNAYLTLNGVEQSAVSIKSTDSGWSGTGNHNTNYSFTINNLTPTQTSVPISFRVSRTGTAANDYSKSSALKTIACTPLDIEQGVGQSTFNSISNCLYNGTFSMSITSYSGYDVLQIKNGSTVIQTFYGVTNGTAYSFGSNEQSTILGLIGANNTYKDLTATLTTYVSNGGASLGSTDKTIRVSLPDYAPSVSMTAISDDVSTYNTYKNTATDLIKTLSKAHITISMSDNYSNNYSSATCNGVSGTISGRTAVFSNLTQTDYYDVSVTDSRGKTGTKRLYGNQYGGCDIWTVQWYKGSLPTSVDRPSPTGSTAIVTVRPTYYNGDNLKSSALLNVVFTFKYTESGSSEVTVLSSSFTESNGEYSYTISGLTPTKTVSWSISGTDKIGVAMNGDGGTLKIGMPVWNAYKNSSGSQFFRINGDAKVGGKVQATDEIIGGLGYGQFRAAQGNYGFFIRNDGSNTYFMLTNSGDAYGSWNGLRPITVQNGDGKVHFGNGVQIDSDTNLVLNGGRIEKDAGTWWIGGRDEAIVKNTRVDGGSWNPVTDNITPNGDISTGTLGDCWFIQWTPNDNYNTSSNVNNNLQIDLTDGYYCNFWTTKGEFKFNRRVYANDFYSAGNVYANGRETLTDEGWVNCWSVAGGLTCRVRRRGNLVYLRVTGSISNGSTGQKATIPDGYRPNDTYHFYGCTGGKRISRWWANASGGIGFDWAINISNASDYNSSDWVEVNSWWFIN